MARDEVKGQEYAAAKRSAMLRVLRKFSVEHSKQFPTARLDEILEVWLDACVNVHTAILDQATRAFLAERTSRWAPTSNEFRDFAIAFQIRRSLDENAGRIGGTRTWEWVDPESQRIAYVQRRHDGWVVHIHESQRFMAMSDREKLDYCDEMQATHRPKDWDVARGVA
jgi:hypothetical protein